MNLSTLSFAGTLGVLVLVALNKMPIKTAFYVGGALTIVGFLTQPKDNTL